MQRLRLMVEIIKILDEEGIKFPIRGAIIGLVETAWDRIGETEPWWRRILNRLTYKEEKSKGVR